MNENLTTLRTGIHSVRQELQAVLELLRRRKTRIENIKKNSTVGGNKIKQEVIYDHSK